MGQQHFRKRIPNFSMFTAHCFLAQIRSSIMEPNWDFHLPYWSESFESHFTVFSPEELMGKDHLIICVRLPKLYFLHTLKPSCPVFAKPRQQNELIKNHAGICSLETYIAGFFLWRRQWARVSVGTLFLSVQIATEHWHLYLGHSELSTPEGKWLYSKQPSWGNCAQCWGASSPRFWNLEGEKGCNYCEVPAVIL